MYTVQYEHEFTGYMGWIANGICPSIQYIHKLTKINIIEQSSKK